jgi:hypothetical protein
MAEPAAESACVEAAAGPIAAAILGRVASALAARAGFSSDRTAELLRVTDAIAGSERVREAQLARVMFTAGPGEVSLIVGPFTQQEATTLLHLPAGSSLDIAAVADATSLVCVRVRD